MYDSITIFVIVLDLFSVGMSFLSLSSCLEKFLWHFCKACLVVLNSLNYCFSGKLLISPTNMMRHVEQSIHDCRFFPFILKYVMLFPFGI